MGKEITAIILAGGKSSRMKQDKGLIYFKGSMLIEYVIVAAKTVTDNILIITSNPAYGQFNYPCIEDKTKDKGPLEGIYTALQFSSTQKNLVLACDMPFLSRKLLTALCKNIGNEDVLLCMHNGKEEPLCAVYDKSCAPFFKIKIDENQLKITSAFEKLKTKQISFDNEEWFTGNEFANINSIEELKKYDL